MSAPKNPPLLGMPNYVPERDGEPFSLRDLFAAFLPEPAREQVEHEAERDRQANPHGDSYKPARRSLDEIRCDLRYRYANAMLAARQRSEVK